MEEFEQDEPSDWPLPQWEQIDTLLRCSICKELLQAPLVLPCMHLYCSLCFREQNSQQCLVCGKESKDIRPMSFISEIVELFKSVRKVTIEALKEKLEPKEETKGKRKMNEIEKTKVIKNEPVKEQVTKPKTFTCPICQKEFSNMKEINVHLDLECLDSHFGFFSPMKEQEAYYAKKKKGKSKTVNNIQNDEFFDSFNDCGSDLNTKKEKPVIHLEQKKKPWYTGLKDRELRNMLRDEDLPTNGDKKTLQNRHQIFINIWNSCADDPNNKFTQKDIVNQTIKREHQLSSSGSAVKPKITKEGYLDRHRDEFDALMKQIKKPVKKEEEIKEEVKLENVEKVEVIQMDLTTSPSSAGTETNENLLQFEKSKLNITNLLNSEGNIISGLKRKFENEEDTPVLKKQKEIKVNEVTRLTRSKSKETSQQFTFDSSSFFD